MAQLPPKAGDNIPAHDVLKSRTVSAEGLQPSTDIIWQHEQLFSKSLRILLIGSSEVPGPCTACLPHHHITCWRLPHYPGPVIFLIFINDLPKSLENPLHLFADDFTLCLGIAHHSDRLQPLPSTQTSKKNHKLVKHLEYVFQS